MKSVLISIQPKWCELIASGKKTIEVRKTRPNLSTPFKCYVYETKAPKLKYVWTKKDYEGYLWFEGMDENEKVFCKVPQGRGKVIGEFVCEAILNYECEFVDDDCYEEIASFCVDEDGDEIGFIEWSNNGDIPYEDTFFYKTSRVGYEELKKYIGIGFGTFYGWHISDLVIYDKPKELSEFRKYIPFFDDISTEELEAEGVSGIRLKRPPQSWCYVDHPTEKGGESDA